MYLAYNDQLKSGRRQRHAGRQAHRRVRYGSYFYGRYASRRRQGRHAFGQEGQVLHGCRRFGSRRCHHRSSARTPPGARYAERLHPRRFSPHVRPGGRA